MKQLYDHDIIFGEHLTPSQEGDTVMLIQKLLQTRRLPRVTAIKEDNTGIIINVMWTGWCKN